MKTVPNKHQISKAEKVKEAKQRNRMVGSLDQFKKTFPTSDIVLDAIFRARLQKTEGNCICGRPLSLYRKIANKSAYKCGCGKKIYPLKGTPLGGCKFNLAIMMQVFYHMFISKNGMSTAELVRLTNVKYDTLFNIRMSVSDLMGECVMNTPFMKDLPIEADECYPYFETGYGPNFIYKRSIYSERCAAVLCLVQRNGICKAFVMPEKNINSVKELFAKYAPKNVTYYTDSSNLYEFLRDKNNGYTTDFVNHRNGEFVKVGNPEVHTNGVEGFNSYMKTALHRIHKGVSYERMQSYLNNLSFNRSFLNATSFEAFDLILKSLPPLSINTQKNQVIRINENNTFNNSKTTYVWKAA